MDAMGTERERKLPGKDVHDGRKSAGRVGTVCHAGHRPVGKDAGPALNRSDIL